MKLSDIEMVKKQFIFASIKAIEIGFDSIEIHATHGYLFHQFLSPISNKRGDKYGGNLENRMRFPLEIFSLVKGVLPKDFSLGIRITGTEWENNGIDEIEASIFAKELEKIGYHYVCVFNGRNTLNPKIPIRPHYQVHLANKIKKDTKMIVRTVGMITDPVKAKILSSIKMLIW